MGLIDCIYSGLVFVSIQPICIFLLEHLIHLQFVCLFVCFCLFRATPVIYSSSWARDQIRTAAASLHHSHSNARSELHLQPMPHLWLLQILNVLSEVRDWIHILMGTSLVLNLLRHSWNSPFTFKVSIYIYVLIVIFLIVLDLFMQDFFLPFLFYSLVI